MSEIEEVKTVGKMVAEDYRNVPRKINKK